MGQENTCGICGLEIGECKLARKYAKRNCANISQQMRAAKPWRDQAMLLKRNNAQHRGLIPKKRQVNGDQDQGPTGDDASGRTGESDPKHS